MNLPSAVRAVVFDMDGVIFDTERVYFAAEDEMLMRRGRRFTVALAERIMGLPGMEAMALVRSELNLEEDVQSLYDEALANFERRIDAELLLMPGFSELLSAVENRGLPRAVATSTARRVATRMLEAYQLPPRFAHILTRDDVVHGKPNPEIYLAACSRLGVDPSQTVVLEDSANGVRAAAAAGCHTIAVRHEHNQQVPFAEAAWIATSMADPRLLACFRGSA